MDIKDKYKVIGLMSGTSLDGLDIACCTFTHTSKGWKFKILEARTVKYPAEWKDKLMKAHSLSGAELIALDSAYGKFLGKSVLDFMKKNKLRADFIASHGHTVFHQPAKGFTWQAGNVNAIHGASGLPVVSDFRSLDVNLGGEGAPLVPAGDKVLFHEYDICLNLGGIANLSMDISGKRIAFDICFANMCLNYLAAKAGKEYDAKGRMASRGQLDVPLLESIEKVYERLRKKRPSLAREIFESDIQPLLDREDISVQDKLRTFTESSAREIVRAISSHKPKARVLCTGGGTFNSFLISRILELGGDNTTLIIPDEEIIKFKEALVFAFLGVLRVRGEINCFKSVTGATRDNSGGVLIGF